MNHALAPVGTQQLRRDYRGEDEQNGRDVAIVLVRAGQVDYVGDAAEVREKPADGYQDRRRRHRRAEEQDHERFGPSAAPKPEAGSDAVYEQRPPRPRPALARARVSAVAEIEHPAVAAARRAGAAAVHRRLLKISASRRRRGPRRRNRAPASARASRMWSYSASPTS